MLWLRSKRVLVQQDGASPHPWRDDPGILDSAGMGREPVTQPSKSPDLNINDLGCCASLKSRVWEVNPSSIEE
ncbi:unnamed protein product [Sphacelaria rigidula]